MKVVVLAGGLGTRLSEETQIIPKPMVQIGGKPILWHIMKIYSSFGYNDFIVLTGYKSHVIKEFFVNYYQRYSDTDYKSLILRTGRPQEATFVHWDGMASRHPVPSRIF